MNMYYARRLCAKGSKMETLGQMNNGAALEASYNSRNSLWNC